MDDQTSANVSTTIKDVRPGRDVSQHSRNSSSLPLRQDSLRRLSNANDNDEINYETPKRPKFDNLSFDLLNQSDFESKPGSPWEWRRMKGEIIALKAKLSQQKATVQQLHNVRREMEEVFQKQKKMLEIQSDYDKQVIKQLELRVDLGRKTVQEAKAAQAHAERDLIHLKSKMEEKVLSLANDNTKLKEELRSFIKQENETETSIAKSFKIPEEKQLELERLEATTKRVTELEEQLREARTFQYKYELQCAELHSLKIKNENLEAEKTSWEEGKNYMNRAAKANELEKELHHAREIINSLRESVKGKLLLEEQMATIEHRLQRTEKLEKQISQLEITQAELLSKIGEYESIGITGDPITIRREINRLQHSEVLLTAAEGQLRSQVDSIERQLKHSEQKHEETKKLLAETTNSQERLTRFVGRLQKRMSLVSRERDSYRDQLDTYEKEITGYQSGEANSLLSERIPALERAVDGYRDLVAKLESDLEAIDGKGQREEMKKLKDEIEKLKGELEHRALKGDFNINARILHYKFNPASIAEQQAKEKQNALLEELKQLRAIAAAGNASGVTSISSFQAQELSELQQKHEIKITRLKEAFKASSHEYRQACYQLFGWRVDRTKEGQYKLSSQYAESPDDYLFFIVNEDGVNMIETPFSATLAALIERYLKVQHSVPMFLNAVQSDLFDQLTFVNPIG